MTGLTFLQIYPQLGPVVASEYINYNFSLINGFATSGDTIVSAGTNIVVIETMSSSTPIYTVSTSQDPIFNSLSATTISGGTYYSGNTPLTQIFALTGTTGAGTVSSVGAFGNLFTGGTATNPIIEIIDSPFFNNITISGTGYFNALSATTFSASTINSGTTNLYNIFQQTNTSILGIGPGSNITTGGTQTNPTISLVDSPSINGLTVSGTGNFNIVSATTLSASTYISGSTNLYSIFQGNGIGVQSVGSIGNIITGGTFTNPIIKIVDSPIFNNETGSGTSIWNAFSATTISASTEYVLTAITDTIRAADSGGLGIVSNNNTLVAQFGAGGGANVTFQDGTTIKGLLTVNNNEQLNGNLTVTGTGLFNSFSATTVSGGTYYSGSTPLNISIKNLLPYTSVGTSVDGQTAVCTTGVTSYITMPMSGTIIGWTIVADQTSPTCTFDVWKISGGSSLPTSSNSIINSGSGGIYPALTTGNAIQSTNISNWTATISENDIFGFYLSSVTIATKVTFQLQIQP